MDYLLFAIILILALYGLTNLIWSLFLWLTKSRAEKRPFVVLPLDRDCDDAAFELQNAALRIEQLGRRGDVRLVAVDCGLDPCQRDVVTQICRANQQIVCCFPEDLPHLL